MKRIDIVKEYVMDMSVVDMANKYYNYLSDIVMDVFGSLFHEWCAAKTVCDGDCCTCIVVWLNEDV